MKVHKNAIVALLGLSLWGCQQSPMPVSTSASPSPDPQICCGGEETPENPRSKALGIQTHDFGQVTQGDKLSHKFSILNIGQEPIGFQREPEVSYPCCMKADVKPNPIPPGAQATVEVTYDTRLRPGNFDLFVRLFPNKPGSITDQFHLGGEVSTEFKVSHSQLSFESPGTQTVEITGSELGKTFQIKGYESNTPHLTFREKESSKPNHRLLDVTWDGEPFELGKKTAVVYVLTDSKKFDWYPILVENPMERFGPK